MVGAIQAIWRYPVSSLAGEQLEQADLDLSGVVGDRMWGLADQVTGEPASPESAKRWRPVPEISARSGVDSPDVALPGGQWISANAADASVALSR